MRLSALVALLVGVLLSGCATTQDAVPVEQGYVDPGYQIFELVQRAIEDIGGEVVAAVRQVGSVTGRIPDEVGGAVVYIDVSIDRGRGPGDESWVRAKVRSESAETPNEDLEYWRQGFFEALDALAVDPLDPARSGRRQRPLGGVERNAP